MRARFRAPALLVAAMLGLASPALAGPPLLCHPFDIGDARSLPWDGASWWRGHAGYDINRLVGDTESLLASSTPIIVRMETLRRATLYASQDPRIAETLKRMLTERARASETSGHPDALAFLDAAYVTEALYEITYLDQMAEFRDRVPALRRVVANERGYALIQKSLSLNPDDPGLHFAAALISADGNRQAYAGHASKARAGAARDALLARNIQHVS